MGTGLEKKAKTESENSSPGLLFEADGTRFRSPKSEKGPWYERWASILSLPLSLALIAAVVQWRVANISVSKDYVALSTDILRDPRTSEGSPALRNWAVDVLEHYSAAELSEELKSELRSGKARLPDSNIIVGLLSELQKSILDAEIQHRAAFMGIPMPQNRSKELQPMLESLAANGDTKVKNAASQLLNALKSPPDVTIEIGN